MLLDDPRSRPGGSWHEAVERWSGERIRKLVRRADGKRWTDVQEFDGHTVTQPGPEGFGQAQVRSFVPAPCRPLPKALDKLQVSGTHFPPEGLSMNADAVAVIEISPELELTSGKLAAQCGHAAQRLYELADDSRRDVWRDDGFRVEVRRPGPEVWAKAPRPVSIVDSGFTELDAPAETVRGFWRQG